MRAAPSPLDFDLYFRDHYPRLVTELDFILGDTHMARDVAQDAFIKQYMDWSKLSTYEKPAAWVRRVALRAAFRLKRRWFRSRPLDEAADIAGPELNHERTLDVRAAIKKLSSRQRTAVVLHYYRGLSTSDVADAMSCKEATARAHLFAARKQLAELLVNYAPQK